MATARLKDGLGQGRNTSKSVDNKQETKLCIFENSLIDKNEATSYRRHSLSDRKNIFVV